MAKQKKTTDFNMAREIRELIAKEPQMTGREVTAALKKKFPRQKINANSCGVAFSNARKKLGLRSEGRARSSSGVAIDVGVLHAAKNYLAACGGDVHRASAGLKKLSDLQF
jgi:hypothetical protein